MRRRIITAGLGLWLAVACTVPAPTAIPVALTPPAGLAEQGAATALAPTVAAEATVDPAAIVPTVLMDTGPVQVPAVNADNPLRQVFPTPIVLATPEGWRPPLLGVPIAARPQDHYWFARPIASDNVNYPLGSYRYGSDYFGQMNIHAGIDIDAPQGTPILAAGPGVVEWAGWGLFLFDPRRTDDPYGIAVLVRHDFGYKGQAVFTLYAHMEAQNNLFKGQRVETGEILGWVGSTGNSTGPHVHFEVRVGQNDYYQTRNPELWIAPYTGWGVLAGQVLDKAGRYAYSVPINVYDSRDRLLYTLYTYGDRVARPDDEWRENFVISDLPAGRYKLRATLGLYIPPVLLPTLAPTAEGVEGAAAVPAGPTATLPRPQPIANGEVTVIEGFVDVVPGQTTFIILQEERGLLTGVSPAETATPPYPTNTFTPTQTPTQTATPTATRTPRPSLTPTRTRTLRPTVTVPPTRTPSPTRTVTPTRQP